MIHMSGEEAETQEMCIEAREKLIKGGAHVKKLYVLKEGTVMVTPRAGSERLLTKTEYIGIGSEWSILGARPFFSMGPSPFVYTALTDCKIYTFDTRMFQTESDGKGLSKESLLTIARGLVLNSDISEIFVPKIAKAFGFNIPTNPNLNELQAGIELITAPHHRENFRKKIFQCLIALLKKHEEVSKNPIRLVGSAALVRDKRRTTAPPPAPGSLPRRMWEAGRAS